MPDGPKGLPNKPMFSVKEAAALCGRHFRTLYRYRDLGLLPMHRTGGQYMIYREDLIRFLERGGREPPGGRGDVIPLLPRAAQHHRLAPLDTTTVFREARWG